MKRILIIVGVVCIGLGGYSRTYAEPASNPASLSLPNKFGVTGLYTLIGTDTLGDKTLSIGLSTDFSEFSLPEDPRKPRLKELSLHAGFSLHDKIEIGGLFPYRMVKTSDESDIEGFKESGIGDILATAKYRLINEQGMLPAIGIFSMISFPTGDEEKGLGSGSTDVTVGGMLTKHFGPVNLYGNLGFLWSGWEEGDPNLVLENYQDSLLYGFGLEFPTTNNKIRLFSEFTFVHEFGDDEDVVDDVGQMSIGGNTRLTDELFLSGGAAYQILGEEPVPDAPLWRGFVNLSYIFGRRKAAKPAEVEPLATEVSNRCPEITAISLSDSVIRGGENVRIAVTASDPDNDQLFYFWVAYRGKLEGRGSQIVWTAPECDEIDPTTKTYDLKVEVSDGECTVDRVIQLSVDCGPEIPSQAPDGTIFFPSGSTKLDNIAKAQLDTIATLLKQFPDQTIILEGHTDATGKEEINKQIGLKRAESAKQYLVKRHGIDPNCIVITSYGSTRPVATNDTREGRAKNRRVEIYRRF